MENAKSKHLSPQAAEYYKRLLLVSDRYYLLAKERNRYRNLFWISATAIVVMIAWYVTNTY